MGTDVLLKNGNICIKTPFSGVDKDPISTLRFILIMDVYIFNRSLIKLHVLQLLYKTRMAHPLLFNKRVDIINVYDVTR